MAEKDRIFFPNLDGFRFLSFLIVFLLHGFKEVLNNHEFDSFILTTIKIALFQSGQLGVSFFFVLSGFLITYLILAEDEKIGKFDAKAFYIRRSLRIFPLYFAFLILTFGILPFFIEINLPNPFYYFFFLSNFDIINTSGGANDLLNITWSVSVEEQFYLFWAVLFAFIRPKYFRYVFPLIIIASAFFRWQNRNESLVLFFHTFSVVSDLAIGGLMAYLVIYSKKFKSFFEELPAWTIIFGYFVVIPLLVFSRFLYIYATFGRIILALAIAFIILEQNYSKNSFYKMENRKTISSLGKYTYGLYLLHPLVIYFVFLIPQKLGLNVELSLVGLTFALLSLAMSILVCYISYEYFEAPFLKLKKRFSHIKTYKTEIGEENN